MDIAYVKDGRFWPVEIKWTGSLRPKVLKQIGKYANSRILARRSAPTSIGGIPVEFLPQTLLRLDLEERAGAYLLARRRANFVCVRKYREFTLNALAERVGVSKGYLSQIENGQKPGTLGLFRQLASILNVAMDELVRWEE